MACDITSGFSIGCRDNAGGIANIYILSGSTATITTASAGLINGITGSGVFYKFEQQKNVGSFDETPTPSLENGTVYYDQAVNVSFHKLQASIRNQVATLAQNTNLKIVVETNNGQDSPYSGRYFYVGRYRGAALSAAAGSSGTAFGDANQYSLTFQGLEPEPAFEIQSSDGTLGSALSGITVS